MHVSRRQTLRALPGLFSLGLISVSRTSQAAEHHDAEKLGFLIIGHGSPSDQWNRPFLDFGERVGKLATTEKGFAASRTVLMEFGSPNISDGLHELEEAGCQAIVAVPAFVMTGHHTVFDVPAALGIYYSQHAVEHLGEHGSELGKPRVPVIYTAPLDEGDLLERFALSEIKKLSQDPQNEAIVFLYHGDAEQRPLQERRLSQIANWCCAKTGITWAEWIHIGIGQGFEHHGMPVLLKAAEKKARVLVIGVYTTLSAAAIQRRAQATSPQIAEQLQGRAIVFSQGSLTDFPETDRHLLSIAEAAAKIRTNEAHHAHPGGHHHSH